MCKAWRPGLRVGLRRLLSKPSSLALALASAASAASAMSLAISARSPESPANGHLKKPFRLAWQTAVGTPSLGWRSSSSQDSIMSPYSWSLLFRASFAASYTTRPSVLINDFLTRTLMQRTCSLSLTRAPGSLHLADSLGLGYDNSVRP